MEADLNISTAQNIFDSLSRNFAVGLAGLLRTYVDVKLVASEQISARQFLMRADDPTCLAALREAALDEPLLLEINFSILFPMIDRMLGGGRAPAVIMRRPLTDIEKRLSGRVAAVLAEQLRSAWNDLADLHIAVDRVESHWQGLQTVPAEMELTLLEFRVELGNYGGPMNLGIPTSLVERILPSDAGTIPGEDQSLIPLIAQLNTSKISAADLDNLEIGDLIATDHKADEPVTIAIDGVPRFLGRLGALAGRKAVRIESAIEASRESAE